MTPNRSISPVRIVGPDIAVLVASLATALLLSSCKDDEGGDATDASRDTPPTSMADGPVEVVKAIDADAPGPADGPGGEVPPDGDAPGVDHRLDGDGGSDGNDGGSTCQAPARLRYTTPGCGAKAPAGMCWAAAMDACHGGYICACDGTVIPVCETWANQPWAYRVDAPNPPATCDPRAPPDGGARD